jgi:hypothetical protein
VKKKQVTSKYRVFNDQSGIWFQREIKFWLPEGKKRENEDQ